MKIEMPSTHQLYFHAMEQVRIKSYTKYCGKRIFKSGYHLTMFDKKIGDKSEWLCFHWLIASYDEPCLGDATFTHVIGTG